MKPLKKRRGWVFVLSVTLLAFIFFPSLQAADDSRLTVEDLVKMQEQIMTNGWTFQVDFNSASDYNLNQLVAPSPVKGNQRYASSAFALEQGDASLGTTLPRSYACVCTPVENQGCASSWPWASTDMFESVIKLKDGVTVDLSEQWLLDCNPYGWDCIDGWFASDIFFRDGAVLSSNYSPGTPCDSVTISYQAQTWHFCKNGHTVAPTNSIKTAIMNYGSVACMVYADMYFQYYSGGVFNASNQGDVNHFVTLCGWDDSKGAWRLKNTWGTSWGESGFMWITYGCHDVGWAANYLVYE